MRILVHDYAGHPFQVQLSRALARRGHVVLHAYCASLQTTPRGALQPQPNDPETLKIRGLHLQEPLDKFSFVKRWRQENEYGRLVADEMSTFRPDVVLSGNTPLDAQRNLWRRCEREQVGRVFWLQDLIGVATRRLLRQRLPVVGAPIGYYYDRLERRLLRASDAVVLITDDFVPIMQRYGMPGDNLHVIENWAPLDEMPVRPRNNAWARDHGLVDKTCLLYSGTLGMKHNPELLLVLARHFHGRDDLRVVVVSQGLGADWLADQRDCHDLDNLVLMGFQPYDRLADVLGAADVLIAILEPDAGIFSVPSKVLTYHCARRPVLLAVPPENLSARIVERNQTGRTVAPTETDAFVEAAETLVGDANLRDTLGANARRYAECTFALDHITDAFEDVLANV